MQHIPLVLETPSFELPREVWAKEIEVLNSLSGLEIEPAEGAELGVESCRTYHSQTEQIELIIKLSATNAHTAGPG